MTNSRIPRFDDLTVDGMSKWFQEMADRDLIFHPDDPPQSIVFIKTGERVFSDEECVYLERVLKEMFDTFGDKVHDAAYPIFMMKAGIVPEENWKEAGIISATHD